MKFFVVAFFILCFGSAVIESVELKCKFLNTSWFILVEHYECSVNEQGDVILDQSNRTIDKITGIHQESKTNYDVKSVAIYRSNCYYFPLGLEKFFPNLEGISIWVTKLREIRKNDFKKLRKLREIYFFDNEFQFLERNLFKFTPKLEFINIRLNKITHIDAKVFNKFMGQLRWLFLDGNGDKNCNFGEAWDDIQKANEIITKVQTGPCKDESKLQPFEFKKCLNRTISVKDKIQTKLVLISPHEF